MDRANFKLIGNGFTFSLLISLYFTCVFSDKFQQSATKYDIEYLQSQIDAKSTQIESILNRVSQLESLTFTMSGVQNQQDVMISALMSNMTNVQGSISYLQGFTVDIDLRQKSTDNRFSPIENDIRTMKASSASFTNNVNQSLNKINRTLVHLNDVNQLWKGNFRNINITFHNIKKKVNFVMPTYNREQMAWLDV